MTSARVGVFALAFLLGCGGAAQQSPTAGRAVLLFDVADAAVRSEAELWIDDRYVPRGLIAGLRVAPGRYRIEVRHDAYHTFYAEVRVAGGQRQHLVVRLAPRL